MTSRIERNCVECGKLFTAELFKVRYNTDKDKEEEIYYHYCFNCYKEWMEAKRNKKTNKVLLNGLYGKCLLDSDEGEE